MASFGKHFAVDQKSGRSQDGAVKTGSFYRITVLTERLIRLEYSREGRFVDMPSDFAINRKFDIPKFKFQEDDRFLIIDTSYFSLQYEKDKPFKGPSYAPDTNLKVKLLNTDKVWYYGQPEARNFPASTVSLDDFGGENIKLGKGLYSTDGFVSIDDSFSPLLNDQGIAIEPPDDHIDIYLFMYKRDFGLCLKDYFTLTGYPTMIPRYALGVWWYRDRIYSFDDTKKLVNIFNKKQIPLSILMLGEFWHTKDMNNINLFKTGYTFSKDLFPSPTEFTTYMHDHGVKVGIQIDPSEGIIPTEPAYSEIIKDTQFGDGNTIPFRVFDKMFIICYFDLLINPLTRANVDFFWIDYKDEIMPLRILNYYHVNDFKQSEYKRPLIFSRYSGGAAHRNTVLYSGETLVSWKTLDYLPYYNTCASNLGLSWWSHDIGGFKEGIEDAELYMRYVQFGTFSPIFRFSAKRGIYYKREPWRWDFKTYNIVKEYTWLRQALIPYLYSEAYSYSKNGLPLIQPLYYSYPELVDEPGIRNEYYFGSELFVCPITHQKDLVMNRAIHKLFIPDGVWYEFKTGKKFIGGKHYVTFYKDEDYPVFAKAGSIIPMANINEDTFNSVDNPSVMDIHIFPGKSNNYSIYEDDGSTRLYEQGFYIVTNIDYNYMQNNYTVIIRPFEGKTSIIPNLREYRLLFRNTKEATSVKVSLNAQPYDDHVTTEIIGNDFVVTIKDVDTTRQLTVNCSGADIEIDGARIINDDINSIINDLMINTSLKEELSKICFSSMDIKAKRIAIRKLQKNGLSPNHVKMFMKLYDYLAEI